MADGFGPGTFESSFAAQMGQPVTINLEINGEQSISIDFTAPERILGVKRYIWNCYADRPGGYVVRKNVLQLGCGGWIEDRVHKWLSDRPVKIWSTGRPEYQQALDTVLGEFSPLLNLEFEHVADAESADLRAYVGVPVETSYEIGFGEQCTTALGCASKTVDYSTGVVSHGIVSAWHFEPDADPGRFKSTIAHELLHVLAGVGHRPTPDALMGSPLSWGDKQLLGLNSHPLVKPGMSMDQVRNLVVLNDELLDPAQPKALDLVWQSAAAIEPAGSAQFDLTGNWIGSGCSNKNFGPATVEVGAFDRFQSRLAHLQVDDREFWFHEWSYWTLRDGSWQRLQERPAEINLAGPRFWYQVV